MEVIKLTFIETPEFNDQHIRSYDTDLKSGMIEDALRRTRTADTFSPITVGRIASNLIRPTGQSGLANIEGGWGRTRLRFAMVVALSDRNYHKEHSYITGYTDFADYSVMEDGNVRFDPDMKMYFNSVSRVSLIAYDNHGTNVMRPKLESHDQVLSRSSMGRNSRDSALMRPSDIFRRRNLDVDDSIMGGLSGTYTETFNRVGAFNSELAFSTRRNNSPTAYLHRSISSYAKSSDDVNASMGASGYAGDHDEVMAGVIDRVDENRIESDPWFDEKLRSETNALRSGYISYGELLATNPDLDEDRIVGLAALDRNERYRHEAAMNTRSDAPEAIAAQILAGSIPSLMLNAMYSRVENLVIDTHALYEEDRVIPGMAFPFVDGLDTSSTDMYFIDQIEHMVIPDISRNGMFSVTATLTIDIDGVIEGNISVDGGPEEYFCFPVFSDALNANVLSDSFERLDRISSDVMSVSEAFYQDKERRNAREVPDRSTGSYRSTPLESNGPTDW